MIDRLRVLEIAGSVAGGYATKLLAGRGASVTVVTPGPRLVAELGLAARSEPVSAGMTAYLAAAKHHHPTTDLGGLDDVDELARLVADADVVVESSAPDPLVPVSAALGRDQARIDVAISPFGSSGPWRNRRSTDLTDQAASGHLYLNGDPDREPLKGPDHQVAYAAGTHAAIGALAALRHRSATGDGQVVEVTHHEVMSALHQFTLFRHTHNGDILTRMGNRYAGPGRPAGIYRCRDGLITLIAPRGDQLETLVSIAGLDHLLDEPGIDGIYDLMHHPTLLDEHLARWLETQDLAETIELLQAVRVPAGAVSTMADLLADEHLAARDAWEPIVAGPSSRPARAPRSPIITTRNRSAAAPGRPPGRVAARPAETSSGPLAGIRVLDLTRVWAGPYATRTLADLGAEVIMIEAPWARGGPTIDRTSILATRYYPDNEPGERHWNRIGFSNKYNINKRNLALDLTKPEALAVLEALIAEADVLIENYSPRVMPQFGLDQDRLDELNPALVYVTMPGFGRSGPARDRIAYGPIVDSQAGLSALMGYEGESARKAGVAWPDPVAGMHAAFATIAALADRDDDGAGRTVELAQVEATIAMAGHAIIDRQLTGAEPTPIGNRHQTNVPHGVYRCAGHDRWLAVAVVDDASWTGLCRVAGFEERWVSFTAAERRAAEAEIDAAISAVTINTDHQRLADELQAAGVPAAAVADAAQVMADPHHAARSYFVTVEHPEAGSHRWPRLPIRLSATPEERYRPAPNLNQDGRDILATIAGLDPTSIEALSAAGATADRPPD